MSDDSLANYFKKRAERKENRPADTMMEILSKVKRDDKPSELRHMPPDPTATTKPDGDKPDPPTPKPTRRRFPKPSM